MSDDTIGKYAHDTDDVALAAPLGDTEREALDFVFSLSPDELGSELVRLRELLTEVTTPDNPLLSIADMIKAALGKATTGEGEVNLLGLRTVDGGLLPVISIGRFVRVGEDEVGYGPQLIMCATPGLFENLVSGPSYERRLFEQGLVPEPPEGREQAFNRSPNPSTCDDPRHVHGPELRTQMTIYPPPTVEPANKIDIDKTARNMYERFDLESGSLDYDALTWPQKEMWRDRVSDLVAFEPRDPFMQVAPGIRGMVLEGPDALDMLPDDVPETIRADLAAFLQPDAMTINFDEEDGDARDD